MSEIKIFNEITKKYQELLNKNIKTKSENQKHRYTYESIIIPIIEKYTQELNKSKVYNYLFRHEFKSQISRFDYNIIIETLSKHLSHKHFNIPLLTRANVYNKYPLLIQCLLIKNDIKNVSKIVKELLECDNIDLIREDLEMLLEYCLKFDKIVNKNSVLSIYNGFNGIEFKNVSIDKETFEKNSSNKLVINIGYNFDKPMKNVVYKRTKYDKPFINTELIENYKSNIDIIIKNNPIRYEFIKKNNDKYMIAINYNDEYYSTTDPIYELKDLEMFNNGSLLYGYDNNCYLNYVSELFYTYNGLKDKTEEKCEVSKYLGVPLKTFYNKNLVITIKKWEEFCDKDRIIFENSFDKKCFKIYISRLTTCVDDNNELDLFKYISYISNYFIPDLA